jgi:cytochrome c biogenesis protein CcmG/thiol:disulfide interchange protein DsbE
MVAARSRGRWLLALCVAGALACGGEGEPPGQAEARETAPSAAEPRDAGSTSDGDAPSAVPAAASEAAAVATAADDDRRDAPSWELPDLEGNPISSSRYAGKIMVVDFWATWCPPCLFQIPILNAVQAKHADDDVAVIGVAVDAEGAEVVAPYAEENGIEYQLVMGDEGLARKFGAPGFPALAIVSPEGKIDSMHVGLIEEEDLEAAIAKVRGS